MSHNLERKLSMTTPTPGPIPLPLCRPANIHLIYQLTSTYGTYILIHTASIMSSSVAAEARQVPLSFMEELDPLVSLYRPSSPKPRSSDSVRSPTDHTQQPRLIIIASWTDARDVHIAKYVAKYQALYPAAQILLLKSTLKCIINPSRIGPSIKHAAAVVHAAFPPKQQAAPPPPRTTSSSTSFSSSTPQFLIHIFSNGGSSSIANLYEQYAATAVGPDDDKRLPPHVTVFDSSPGTYSIPRAVAFASVGLSSFLQRLIAAPILYALAALWSASIALGFSRDVLRDWGSTHNNTNSDNNTGSSSGDGGNVAEVRRVYIYSPGDALIDYRDVEAHAAEAESRGFSVALERYEGSAHVAHVRKDEGRYWEIVERIMTG
ncbi:hypothetical protein F4678DRAFT_434206 [Xylaria arbuscula]|nr:hypothetical protein F4678DRAFT_434206 [Xylaria arbuscula]